MTDGCRNILFLGNSVQAAHIACVFCLQTRRRIGPIDKEISGNAALSTLIKMQIR